jgi:HEAT repeat protein
VKHPAFSRLQHKDVRQRRLAVKRLFELDDPESLSGFIPLLSDEDPWFRKKGMEAVGRWLGHGQGKVVEMLTESPYPEQRVLAANLALRGEGGGTGVLLGLCEDPEPSVRLAAWKARMGVDNSKIATVITLALKDEEAEVRRIALRRLSFMEVVDPNLLGTVLSDPSPRVVLVAISLVEKRLELSENPEIETQLIAIAEGGEGPMREAAIGVLAGKSLDSPNIAALVLDLAEDGSSGLVSSLVAGLRGVAWWNIEGFADRLVTSADDGLVARLLRGERSDEVVPIRNEILSDPSKSSLLRARIIEDLIGRQVDKTTIDIVKILSESDEEPLSAISRSLLSEAGSLR